MPGWWKSREDKTTEREKQLDLALARVYEAQSSQVQALTSFLTQIADLSIKRAAVALGQRGGQARARNRKEKMRAQMRERVDCPLCADPMRTDVTVEMIAAHRAHAPANAAPKQIDYQGGPEGEQGNGSADNA